jgi:catechol 2,3-dioxygenase-like lactoylglutathione lyase family enzyme
MENEAKERNAHPQKQDDESYRPIQAPAALKVIFGGRNDQTSGASEEAERSDGPMAVERFVPAVLYDGGVIETTMDEHEPAIQWCRDHMGWKVAQQENWKPDPRSAVGRMTHMGWGIWIQSGTAADGSPFPPAKREAVDPHIRWCWSMRSLRDKHSAFREAGIRVSELYADRQGREAFDFWAIGDRMLLTAVEDRALKDDAFADYNVFRIMVKDLKRSIEWYKHYIGMELETERSEEGYAVMTLGVNYHPEGRSRWVLEENPGMPDTGPVDGLFRTRCFVQSREDFFAYHRFLRESGTPVSEIGGFVQRGMVHFHVYDPDGNRFNVSSM